jgi:hypothetical protein
LSLASDSWTAQKSYLQRSKRRARLMAEANESPNDDLWQFAEFCMTEAFLLRSFLENLRLRKDSPEAKIALLSDWKRAVGLTNAGMSTFI